MSFHQHQAGWLSPQSCGKDFEQNRYVNTYINRLKDKGYKSYYITLKCKVTLFRFSDLHGHITLYTVTLSLADVSKLLPNLLANV